MLTRAVLRYVRISPRKVRPVIPLIKGKNPEEAISILFNVKKKASGYLIDLLESAIANAKRIQGVNIADLYISSLVANGGPQMKRFRAASMGRAGMIRKRTSHITLELDRIAQKSQEAKIAAHAQASKPVGQVKEGAASKGKKSDDHSAAVKKTKTRTKEPAKTAAAKKDKE